MAFAESTRVSRQYGLLTVLPGTYDEWIGFSFDVDPLPVTRQLIEEARQPIGEFQSHGAVGYSAGFLNHQAQLAVVEGRPQDALRLVLGLDEALAFPAINSRAHLLAIHLAARTAIDGDSRIDEIVAGLAACFLTPRRWLDWPATVYAAHLELQDDVAAAPAFASRYVREIRRELYPAPPMLENLCTLYDSAHAPHPDGIAVGG